MASLRQNQLLERLQSSLPPFTNASWSDYHRLHAPPCAAKENLLARLNESGFSLQFEASTGGLLYFECPGKLERSIFLYSRYPALSRDASSLQATVSGSVDGCFYAPEVAGVYGTILAWLAGLDLYRAQFGDMPVTIKWLFDGGSATESWLLEEFLAQSEAGLKADLCLCSGGSFAQDGSPLLALGVKGRLGLKLKVRTASHPIDLQHGTIVPNALWRMTWALANLKDQHEEVLIEDFYDTLFLSDASEIELLYALPDDTRSQAEQLGLTQLLLGLQGFQQHYARYLLPTCTITSLVCESAGTEIPPVAEARLDFFLVPGQQPEVLFQQVRQHLLKKDLDDIEVRWLYSLSPAYTVSTEPLVQRIASLFETVAEMSAQRKPLLLPLASESLPIAPLLDILKCPFIVLGAEYPGSQKGSGLEHLRLADFVTLSLQIALLVNMFEERDHGPDESHPIECSHPGDPGGS